MNNKAWGFLAAIGIGVALLRTHNCKYGCHTIGEHLVTWGIEGLL